MTPKEKIEFVFKDLHGGLYKEQLSTRIDIMEIKFGKLTEENCEDFIEEMMMQIAHEQTGLSREQIDKVSKYFAHLMEKVILLTYNQGL